MHSDSRNIVTMHGSYLLWHNSNKLHYICSHDGSADSMIAGAEGRVSEKGEQALDRIFNYQREICI